MVQSVHLVVLCHGLWGVSDHFNYIESQLQTSYTLNAPSSDNTNGTNINEKLIIYKTKSNERFKTYDGVDLCGTRVAEEIIQFTKSILELSSSCQIIKFSLVGYSLGGLFARYALGVLYLKGYFSGELFSSNGPIKPFNFTTFCSPHVGVLMPGHSISITLFNQVVPFLLGSSGRQLFLKDSTGNEKLPLLTLMTLPNSVFYQALSSFKRISLYSNVRSDIRTSWWCSGISFINPFEILDKNPKVNIDAEGYIKFENGAKFQLSFVQGYENVVLDVEKAITFTGLIDYSTTLANNDGSESEGGLNQMINEDLPTDNSNSTFPSSNSSSIFYKITNFLNRKFKWVSVILKFGLYLPMWMSWFILHNALQVAQSTYRNFNESSKINHLELYRVNYPLNEEEPQLLPKILSSSTTAATSIVNTTTTPNKHKGSLASDTELLDRPKITRRLSETYINELNKLETTLQDQGDRVIESVFDAITSSKDNSDSSSIFFNHQEVAPVDESNNYNEQQNISEPSNDDNDFKNDGTVAKDSEPSLHQHSLTTTLDKLGKFDIDNPPDSISDKSEIDNYINLLTPFKLSLSQQQKIIINNLNQLPWLKFPIYITKTKATHAAAIVRHLDNEESFQEGKLVVKHFVDQCFLI